MSTSANNPKLFVLLGVIAVAALYLMVIKPQGSEMSAVNQRAADAQTSLDTAQAQLAGTSTGGVKPVTATDALNAAVPPTPALPDLLRQLQTMATDSGMAYASVTPSVLVANPAGPGGALDFSISASGPAAAAAAYLQRLKDLARMLVVQQISRTTATGSTQLQLSVRAFTTQSPPRAKSS